MSKYDFYEVNIPYEFIGPDKDPELVAKYRSLLRDKVFPAIDDLLAGSKINSYHFLTTDGLDLRLAIVNADEEMTAVMEVLEKYELPTELTELPPGDSRIDEEYEVRRLSAEMTRALLAHPTPDEFYAYAIHFINNAFGMSNYEEAFFHLNQSVNWLATIRINEEGGEYSKELAFKDASDKIIGVLKKSK